MGLLQNDNDNDDDEPRIRDLNLRRQVLDVCDQPRYQLDHVWTPILMIIIYLRLTEPIPV